MEDDADFASGYFQVRRVLAAICSANSELNHDERTIIASNIGGASGLPTDHISILLEDAATMPSVDTLVSELSHSAHYRQMVADLATLATTKAEWHECEIAAVCTAIGAMKIAEDHQMELMSAFDALLRVSRALSV